MNITLQGCEYKDFMPESKENKGFCLRKDCGAEITHKGTSEYCSRSCFLKDYKDFNQNTDSFRDERYELSIEQGGN